MCIVLVLKITGVFEKNILFVLSNDLIYTDNFVVLTFIEQKTKKRKISNVI